MINLFMPIFTAAPALMMEGLCCVCETQQSIVPNVRIWLHASPRSLESKSLELWTDYLDREKDILWTPKPLAYRFCFHVKGLWKFWRWCVFSDHFSLLSCISETISSWLNWFNRNTRKERESLCTDKHFTSSLLLFHFLGWFWWKQKQGYCAVFCFFSIYNFRCTMDLVLTLQSIDRQSSQTQMLDVNSEPRQYLLGF